MGTYIQGLTRQDINSISLEKMSNEELCVLYQQGNEEALCELATKNTKLLYSRAYKYFSRFNHKLEIEDLVQWGYIGMLRAAQKFDIELKNKFTTYAVWWIDQSISRAIIDEGYTIRLPVHMFEKIEKIHSIIRSNEGENNIDIPDKVAEGLQIDRDLSNKLLLLYGYILNVGSLYTPLGEDGDSFLMDFITYDGENDVEFEVEKILLTKEINKLLSTLQPREQSILEMRFGLNGYEPHTLDEIGNKYELTRERIRQIQERALRKLRQPSRGKQLREFLYEY